MLELRYVNNRECLELVARMDQIENLLFLGKSGNEKVIRMWLQGLPNPLAAYEQGHVSVHSEDNQHAFKEEESLINLMSNLAVQNQDEDIMPLSKLISEAYPWTLSGSSRCRLQQYWLEELKKLATQKLGEPTAEYDYLCHQNSTSYRETDLNILQQARVVGMTTSAAARNWELLVELKPEVVIVEEAAEVLEAHIIACLTPYTQHLILIGDNVQLRPSVSNRRLSNQYKLDVSMFERLVSGGVEHKTLNVQRRMRPSISKLLQRFYPALIDHEIVRLYEDVRGLQKNVFLWDHNAEEVSAGSMSKMNPVEAKMAVELACYLTYQQGYQNAEVTILTLYSGQRECIRRMLGRRPTQPGRDIEEEDADIRVTSVDDFQGEESEIVILSLVRSNDSTVGFADNSNRVCVALSRARKGLYILGNAALFQEKSALWDSVIQDLAHSNSVGTELPLSCPNHPWLSDRVAACAEDISASPCVLPCDFVLPCSHLCPLPCHYMGDHNTCTIVCEELCDIVHATCGHTCDQPCESHTDDAGCPPCKQQVSVSFKMCDHQIHLACHQLTSNHAIVCEEPCSVRLPCGHDCPNRCGKPCATECRERVSFQLPCKHYQFLPCCESSSPVFYECKEKCTKELACGHSTLVPCNQPIDLVICTQIICKELSCGHSAETCCSNQESARCNAMVAMTLSCGHSVQVVCSQQIVEYPMQCTEKVNVKLPCDHTATLLCYQSHDPIQCSQPCSGKLSCGHNCKGTCSTCHAGCHDAVCVQPCAKVLPCSHLCQARCNEQCRPCQVKKPCLHRCVHKRCGLNCNMPCISCAEPCPWKCAHQSCGLLCNEICTRPRCNEACPESLACGHPCIGLCGEPCPTKCRECDPNTLELFTGQKIGKLPAITRLVQLVVCGHICEVARLDEYMDTSHQRQCCPKCEIPVSERTLRYSSILKALHQQAQEEKKRLLKASAHPTSGRVSPLANTSSRRRIPTSYPFQRKGL